MISKLFAVADLLKRAVVALEGIANAQMEIAESARRAEKAADRSAAFLQRFAEATEREASAASDPATVLNGLRKKAAR